MTIIDKIKTSVEGATGLPFLYHAAGEINELVARANSLPISFAFLLDSGTIEDVNGRYHERVTLAVMFTDKTEFDFNALENEEIIDRMKVKAYKWLDSLRNSNDLQIVSVNSTQRLYDTTTDILTGYAVNITLQDMQGVGECELPEVVIPITENGIYNVVGADKVDVKISNLIELEVTENGEYLPPIDILGFSKVNVIVLPKMTDLVVTENNKEYLPADYGVDAFSKVTVNVVPAKRVVLPSGIRITNAQIIDGYWAGELVDTSKMNSMRDMFFSARTIQQLDVSNWDVSNVTDMANVFYGCSQLQNLNVSNWDVSGVTMMGDMFYNCSQLQNLNVSNWDVGEVTNMVGMFYGCSQLQNLNVSNWDVSNVTIMASMFSGCSQLQNLDVSNWTVSKVTNMGDMFYNCSQLQNLNVSNWDVGEVTRMTNMFLRCSQLQNLDVSNWDVSNVTNMGDMFYSCSQLQSLIGNRTIDDVLANNIGALNGLNVALNLSSTILDRASLRAVINGLADLTGQTAKTLTLGTTLMAKLTEEDIAIATNKNWTIV